MNHASSSPSNKVGHSWYVRIRAIIGSRTVILALLAGQFALVQLLTGPQYGDAPRAVGLKPSAMRGEARLRGRERIISSKTIISVYTLPEAGAWRETVDKNNDGQWI